MQRGFVIRMRPQAGRFAADGGARPRSMGLGQACGRGGHRAVFISDDLIFLQLQKTAGTHIAALLSQHLDGRMKGKHGPLDFDPGGRLIAGSVRNPWDWYVSLWAYGCGEQGGVQGLLKNSKLGGHRSGSSAQPGGTRICGAGGPCRICGTMPGGMSRFGSHVILIRMIPWPFAVG